MSTQCPSHEHCLQCPVPTNAVALSACVPGKEAEKLARTRADKAREARERSRQMEILEDDKERRARAGCTQCPCAHCSQCPASAH